MFNKNWRICFLFFIISFFLAQMANASGFHITEVQTSNGDVLSDECVKITNTGDIPLSLLGLILQSHSSNPDSDRWTSRSGDGLPDISIESGKTIVLASNLYSGSDDAWRHIAGWGLSDTGGGMRIIEKDDDGNIINTFAEKYWGTLNPDDEVGLPVEEPEPTPEPPVEEPPDEEPADNADAVGLPAGSPTAPSPSDEPVAPEPEPVL